MIWARRASDTEIRDFTVTGQQRKLAEAYDSKMPEEIRLNGRLLVKGNGHLGVIYNNLVGLNIPDTAEFKAYLAFMGNEYGFGPLVGGEIFEFLTHGISVTEFMVGAGVATRVTESMLASKLEKPVTPSPSV